MIGVEFPRSGNGVRQRMFSFVLQRSGSFDSRATPVPSGPRQAGQFAWIDVQQKASAAVMPKSFIKPIDCGTAGRIHKQKCVIGRVTDDTLECKGRDLLAVAVSVARHGAFYAVPCIAACEFGSVPTRAIGAPAVFIIPPQIGLSLLKCLSCIFPAA